MDDSKNYISVLKLNQDQKSPFTRKHGLLIVYSILIRFRKGLTFHQFKDYSLVDSSLNRSLKSLMELGLVQREGKSYRAVEPPVDSWFAKQKSPKFTNPWYQQYHFTQVRKIKGLTLWQSYIHAASRDLKAWCDKNKTKCTQRYIAKCLGVNHQTIKKIQDKLNPSPEKVEELAAEIEDKKHQPPEKPETTMPPATPPNGEQIYRDPNILQALKVQAGGSEFWYQFERVLFSSRESYYSLSAQEKFIIQVCACCQLLANHHFTKREQQSIVEVIVAHLPTEPQQIKLDSQNYRLVYPLDCWFDTASILLASFDKLKKCESSSKFKYFKTTFINAFDKYCQHSWHLFDLEALFTGIVEQPKDDEVLV